MNRLIQGAMATLALISIGASSHGQALRPNQTAGFADGKVVTFTYTQNYDCVDQPDSNLDFDHFDAAKDATEMQVPICQAGDSPTINPPGMAGNPRSTTDPLFVLVPMFSVDKDQNPNDAITCANVAPRTLCGPQLGNELITLFGAVPEAFKAKPLVFTQCPDGGTKPGRCTMHATRIDLAPVLAKLGYIPNPPTANVFVPSPNHSHVIAGSDENVAAEWWQVLPILVLSQSDWPSQNGSTGLTSVAKIDAAVKAGRAVYAPSNFFLFFASRTAGGMMNMPMGH